MNTAKTKNVVLATLLGGAVLCAGCISRPSEPAYDNPRDKEGSNYTSPAITSLSLSDGATVRSRDLSATWQGNAVSTEYRYVVDGLPSAWTSTTSVDLTDLDEGQHTFSVSPRNDIEEAPGETRTFSVDAIQGPGIVFSPRKVTANTNVALILEDVERLMGAHIEIVCEEGRARLGDLALANATALDSWQIAAYSASGDSLVSHDGAGEGTRLVIDLAYLGGSDGLSGSVDIGRFPVYSSTDGMEDQIAIDRERTVFRDAANRDIQANGLDWVRVVQ